MSHLETCQNPDYDDAAQAGQVACRRRGASNSINGLIAADKLAFLGNSNISGDIAGSITPSAWSPRRIPTASRCRRTTNQARVFFKTQAMFSPRICMVRMPSSSSATSPLFRPMPKFQ